MSAVLSIVVPVYNEEANVLPLAAEVMSAMRDYDRPFEVIFVDDASVDGTWERIKEARLKHGMRIRGLRHVKNCGQSAALWTGIRSSSTEFIATLDGDLQNDPADLPRLLEALKESDFVCGVRTKRRDSWVRKVSSRIARRARAWALGVDFCDTGCAARAFKRSSLEGVFAFNGLHRFLPVIVHGGGAVVREIPIGHRPRIAGVSKYGVWNRLWRGIYDLFAVAWYQRRRTPAVMVEEMTVVAADMDAKS